MLNSAIDLLGPPDSELTPNSIMTDLTEHYVPNSVTRVREHKSVSHVPNISLLNKGKAGPPVARRAARNRRGSRPPPAVARRARSPPAAGRACSSNRAHLEPSPVGAGLASMSAYCQLNVRFILIYRCKMVMSWWFGVAALISRGGCAVGSFSSSPAPAGFVPWGCSPWFVAPAVVGCWPAPPALLRPARHPLSSRRALPARWPVLGGSRVAGRPSRSGARFAALWRRSRLLSARPAVRRPVWGSFGRCVLAFGLGLRRCSAAQVAALAGFSSLR